MKKIIFGAGTDKNWLSFALLILRLTVGILMLTHGFPKLVNFGQMSHGFFNLFNIGSNVSLALDIFAEVFCSILLIIGLASRPALIPLILAMAVAVFMVHAGQALSVKELAIHYLASYIVLLIAGPGKYSVDYLIGGK
jgi:putative oxidoreductase